MLVPEELDELEALMTKAVKGRIQTKEEKERLRELLASEMSKARKMDWYELVDFGRLVLGAHLTMARAYAWSRRRASRGQA